MENEKNKFFRNKGEEKLTSPEQLNDLLEVTDRRSWIALYTVIALMSIALLWSIFGSISIRVHGKGIILHEQGLFSIQSKTTGSVKEIFVQPGQMVSEGDVVALIYDPEQEMLLEMASARVKTIQTYLNTLTADIEEEDYARADALRKQIAAEKFAIEKEEEEVARIKEVLRQHEELAEEGIVASPIVDEQEEELIKKTIIIEQLKGQVAEYESELLLSPRTREFKDKEKDLLRALEERELLLTLRIARTVQSPADGRVLEILSSEGNFVKPGDPIIWLEHPMTAETEHIVYGYVPIDKGKSIHVGAVVQIEPSNVNIREHGPLMGVVEDVSQFAVSADSMANRIHNEGLVEYLMGSSTAVIQLVIMPLKDPNSYSGYKWMSRGKGPNMKLSRGTVCELRTVITTTRPIFYVFPIWKFQETSHFVFGAPDAK